MKHSSKDFSLLLKFLFLSLGLFFIYGTKSKELYILFSSGYIVTYILHLFKNSLNDFCNYWINELNEYFHVNICLIGFFIARWTDEPLIIKILLIMLCTLIIILNFYNTIKKEL